MDRKTEGFYPTESEAIDLLKSLYESPQPRVEKWRTLFRLANRSSGRIFELGTYWGSGAIALALGASREQIVYTVDDYTDRTGWAGEKYGKSDKEMFEFFVDKAEPYFPHTYIHLIEMDTDKALSQCTVDIGLIFWDLGCKNGIGRTLDGWLQHIQPGGILAIHDTYSNLFGAGDYVKRLVHDGKFCQYAVMGGGVHVAVKV